MKHRLKISIFGTSLVSAFRNGAATYYRGLIRALAERGHRITFYEPDDEDRQKHRDMPNPDWARVVIYKAVDEAVFKALEKAEDSDLIIKCSGSGDFDDLLDAAVVELKKPETLVAFLDANAPATLERLETDPEDSFRKLIPEYDFILTHGGGQPVVEAYRAAGATECVPIYAALDPLTHFPVPEDTRFEADLGFLGNRMPDREARVEEFFLKAAGKLSQKRFLLGGCGWEDKSLPGNVNYVGHVFTRDHNAFNCTPRAVLNVTRESMVRYGFCSSTRVFEAAGAGACLITDKWKGIEMFLEPDREVLVAASGDEVAAHLEKLTPERAKEIGQAAKKRILAEHTYAHRAKELERLLDGKIEQAIA